MKQQLIFLLVSCLLITSFGKAKIVNTVKDDTGLKNLTLFTGIEYQIVNGHPLESTKALKSEGSSNKITYHSFEDDQSTTWAIQQRQKGQKYGRPWYTISSSSMKDDQSNNYLQCYNKDNGVYVWQRHDQLYWWLFSQADSNSTNSTLSHYNLINWGADKDHLSELRIGENTHSKNVECVQKDSVKHSAAGEFSFIPVLNNYERKATIVKFVPTAVKNNRTQSVFVGSETFMNCGNDQISTRKTFGKEVFQANTFILTNGSTMGKGMTADAPEFDLNDLRLENSTNGQTIMQSEFLQVNATVTIAAQTCKKLVATYTREQYDMEFNVIVSGEAKGPMLTADQKWVDDELDNTDAIHQLFKMGGATAQRLKDLNSTQVQYQMTGKIKVNHSGNMVTTTQTVNCTCSSSLAAEDGTNQLSQLKNSGTQDIQKQQVKSVEDETAAITVSKPGFLFFH